MMSKSRRVSLLLCLVVGILAHARVSGQTPDILEHSAVANRLQLLESWIEAHMAYEGWPGVSIGIVHDQELIYSHGFGHANLKDRTAVDERTLFPIASNTKMFTAVSILKLRDEGKLALDDAVSHHIERFAMLQHGDAEQNPVTIRQLLTHSSGLPREARATNWTTFSFPPSDQIVEDLPDEAFVWTPETRWKYSNFGVSLLGAIVSRVSGRSFEEYVRSETLSPLGMSRTTFEPSEISDVVLATGYSRRMPDGTRKELPILKVNGYSPAGGLWSSVIDLGKFASWQFRLRERGGDEIVGATTLRDMQRAHWLHSDWTMAWGFGFLIYKRTPHDLVGHGGHVPGYQTDFTASLPDKIAVIVLTNGDEIKVYPDETVSISDRIFTWVVPAIREALAGAPAIVPDGELKKYVGRYRSWAGNDREILIMKGRLVLFRPLNPENPDDMSTLVHVKDHSFRVETANGFDAPGELLVFEEDETGEIVGFRHGGAETTRISSW